MPESDFHQVVMMILDYPKKNLILQRVNKIKQC